MLIQVILKTIYNFIYCEKYYLSRDSKFYFRLFVLNIPLFDLKLFLILV